MLLIFILCSPIFRIWFVLGSEEFYDARKSYIGLNELVSDFSNIVKSPSKYIDLNLFLEDAFDREASGIYKLVPYYQKIYPQDRHQDRYFIQQHPFNGEFQLVKNFDYIYRKNIRSLFDPNKPIPGKKDLSTINTFKKYKRNIEALVEKNKNLEDRIGSLIQEVSDAKKLEDRIKILIQDIQQTKKVKNDWKTKCQNTENIYQKQLEKERKIHEEKIKEKDEEIFELKLKHLEQNQKIFNLEKELEKKESIIGEQTKSKKTYKEESLQSEISNLKNDLKIAKENYKKEKENAKQLEKYNKNVGKTNSNLTSKLVELSKQLEVANQQELKSRYIYQSHLALFEKHYYYSMDLFKEQFLKIPELEKKFRLKKFICNPISFDKDRSFDYERALITYGTFMYVIRIRQSGSFYIPTENIFDPQNDLELPICIDYDNAFHTSPEIMEHITTSETIENESEDTSSIITGSQKNSNIQNSSTIDTNFLTYGDPIEPINFD